MDFFNNMTRPQTAFPRTLSLNLPPLGSEGGEPSEQAQKGADLEVAPPGLLRGNVAMVRTLVLGVGAVLLLQGRWEGGLGLLFLYYLM